MPNFNTAEAGFPAGNSAAGGSANPHLTIQAVAAVPSKGSPKLWPSRKANVGLPNSPTAAVEEWLEVSSKTKEEFGKLHEDFGKEVKELIADWLKRAQADGAGGENLIDFG